MVGVAVTEETEMTRTLVFSSWLAMATETKENIETGLKFVKDSLSYTSTRNFIFLVDKDFDYLETLRIIFPGSKIFLCGVHVYRYWKEKVLPSSKMSDGNSVEKVDIINQLKMLRDAPSEELYEQRREELLEMTEHLLVKPGNKKEFVRFHNYFDKNWHDCRQMW